jgi:YidC/Oxa1 family membrane protein insertase
MEIGIFSTLLVDPLVNALVAIYQVLYYLHIPGALGFSIILLTVLIKFIMYPLTAAQINASHSMLKIQPLMKKLKEKYKKDPKRLQQEQMALFKEHGVNPIAGCLPSLVQIVILVFGFYPVILKIVNLKPKDTLSTINHIVYFDPIKLTHIWDTNFFGVQLGATPASLMSSMAVVAILIPVVTATLQFLQTKMMMATPDQKESKSKNEAPDFSQVFQKQMLYMIPFIIGFVSFQFAIGLSLYWNTFTIFGIIQQYKLQGLGGLAGWVDRLRMKTKI